MKKRQVVAYARRAVDAIAIADVGTVPEVEKDHFLSPYVVSVGLDHLGGSRLGLRV